MGASDPEYGRRSRGASDDRSRGASASHSPLDFPVLIHLSQRELPVVGWVNDFLVFGVIDEVERRELSPLPPTPVQTSDDLKAKPRRTPKKGKKGKDTPATPTKKDEQQKLTSFFSPSPSPAKRGGVLDLTQDSSLEESETEQTTPVEPQPRWGFVLSDTKTRWVADSCRPSL